MVEAGFNVVKLHVHFVQPPVAIMYVNILINFRMLNCVFAINGEEGV